MEATVESKVQHKRWAFVLYIALALTTTIAAIFHSRGPLLARDLGSSALLCAAATALLAGGTVAAVVFVPIYYLYFIRVPLTLLGYALTYGKGVFTMLVLGTSFFAILILFFFFFGFLIPHEGLVMGRALRLLLKNYLGLGAVVLSLWAFLALQGILFVSYLARGKTLLDNLIHLPLFLSLRWSISNFSQMVQVSTASLIHSRIARPPNDRPAQKALSDLWYSMGNISYYSMHLPILILLRLLSGSQEDVREHAPSLRGIGSLAVEWPVNFLRRLFPTAKRLAELNTLFVLPIMVLGSGEYLAAAEKSNEMLIEGRENYCFTLLLCSQSILILSNVLILFILVGWIDCKFVVGIEALHSLPSIALWALAAALYYVFLKILDSSIVAAVYFYMTDPTGVEEADAELYRRIRDAYAEFGMKIEGPCEESEDESEEINTIA
jgi:hypothetical protein